MNKRPFWNEQNIFFTSLFSYPTHGAFGRSIPCLRITQVPKCFFFISRQWCIRKVNSVPPNTTSFYWDCIDGFFHIQAMMHSECQFRTPEYHKFVLRLPRYIFSYPGYGAFGRSIPCPWIPQVFVEITYCFLYGFIGLLNDHIIFIEHHKDHNPTQVHPSTNSQDAKSTIFSYLLYLLLRRVFSKVVGFMCMT